MQLGDLPDQGNVPIVEVRLYQHFPATVQVELVSIFAGFLLFGAGGCDGRLLFLHAWAMGCAQ